MRCTSCSLRVSPTGQSVCKLGKLHTLTARTHHPVLPQKALVVKLLKTPSSLVEV